MSRANPFRPRGLILFALGALPAFLLMAADRRFEYGVFAGAAGVLFATVGLLEFLGVFEEAAEPHRRVSFHELAWPLTVLGSVLGAALLSVRAAVAGVLPSPIAAAGILLTLSLLGSAASGTWVLARLGVLESLRGAPGSLRGIGAAPGFWLLAIAILLYVPMLGSFSLIDPWETHYGEVAREMLARNDWISLWWAHEGWFFSKPVLNFWLQALSFAFCGVRHEPGGMLSAASDGYFPQPEWAARLPVVLLSLVALYLAYRAAARVFGSRAGFLGGLVLTTAPYWFFLAHQSMTDMPYVAPLTGSIALLALGFSHDPEERIPSYEVRFSRRRIRLSAAHLLLGAVVLTVLPQILYLFSRNLSLILEPADRGFQLHADQFFAGSGGGNCGLPGNPPCRLEAPAHPLFQPAVGALLWSLTLGLFLVAYRGERRVARLCFLGAWYLAALALLAKGAPGLLLPILVALIALSVARRFRDFARLELPGSILLVACVALPWHVQAFARHGAPFTDRLLFHDMYKRAFVHVHDTNAGDDLSFGYYVWQLGYGLFPWTGLAAVGLVWWLTEGDEAKGRRAELGALLALWVVLAFSMFTVSLTKFHHYALPMVPPLCLLLGILLDRMLRRSNVPGAFESALFSLAGLSAAGLVLLVGRDLYQDGAVDGNLRLLHLFIYHYGRPWPPGLDFQGVFQVFTALAASACALFAVPRLRGFAAILQCATAVCFTVFCLNVYFVAAAPHWGQRETLFTYYATRSGGHEPLVAFQMNWKGENFYSGNQLATFVTTGDDFQRWLSVQRQQGIRVIYVTTEHSRQATLQRELGIVKSFAVLTRPELNNKFLLARVEL